MRNSLVLADTKKDKRSVTSFRLTDAFSRKSQTLRHSETAKIELTPKQKLPEYPPLFGGSIDNLLPSQLGFKGVPLVVEDCIHHIETLFLSSQKRIDKWDNKTLNKFLCKNSCPTLPEITGETALLLTQEKLEDMKIKEEDAKMILALIQKERTKLTTLNDIVENKMPCVQDLRIVSDVIKKMNDAREVNLYKRSSLIVSMHLLRTFFITLDPPLIPLSVCKKLEDLFSTSDASKQKSVSQLQQEFTNLLSQVLSQRAYATFEAMCSFFQIIGNHPKSGALDAFTEIVVFFFQSFNPNYTFNQGCLDLLPIFLGLTMDDSDPNFFQQKFSLEDENRYDGEVVAAYAYSVMCPYFFFPPASFDEITTAGWFNGNAFVTNYRVVLACDQVSLDSILFDCCFTQVPLCDINTMKITKETVEGKVYYVLRIATKDFRNITFFSLTNYSDEFIAALNCRTMFFNVSTELDKFELLGIQSVSVRKLMNDDLKRQGRREATSRELIDVWKNPNTNVELKVCQSGLYDGQVYEVKMPTTPISEIIDLIQDDIEKNNDQLYFKMTQFASEILDPAKEVIKLLLTKSVILSVNSLNEFKALLGLIALGADSYYLSLEGFLVLYRTYFKFTDTQQRMIFLWMVWLVMNQHTTVFGFNASLLKFLFYTIHSFRFNDELLQQFVTLNKSVFASLGKMKFAIFSDVIPRPAELFFQHPNLRCIPKMNQQIVSMKNTTASTVPPFTPTTIQTLDAENNRFLDIPNTVLTCVKLVTMKLQNNKIYVLSDGIANFQNLTYLDLSNNLLKTFPLLGRVKLRYLDISNNPLTSLGFLPTTLTTLNMRNLSKMPDLSQHSLVTLDCNGTSAISTKTLFKNLPITLKVLDIGGRDMLSLPFKLSRLVNLTKLNISNNKISSLHPSFFEMGIKDLNIEQNSFKILPPTFKKMKVENLIKDTFVPDRKQGEKRVVIIDNSTELFNALIRVFKQTNLNIREDAHSAKITMRQDKVVDIRVISLDTIETQPYLGIDALYIIHSHDEISFRIIDLCQYTSTRNYIVVADKKIDENALVLDETFATLKSVCKKLRTAIDEFSKEDLPAQCFQVLRALQAYDLSPAVMSPQLFKEVCDNVGLTESEVNKAVRQLTERRLIHRNVIENLVSSRKSKFIRPGVIAVRMTYSSFFSNKSEYSLVDTKHNFHIASSLSIQNKGVFTARALQCCKMHGLKDEKTLQYITSILEEYSIVLIVREELSDVLNKKDKYTALLEQARKMTLVSTDVSKVGDATILVSLVGVPFMGEWNKKSRSVVTKREYLFNKFPLQLEMCLIGGVALEYGIPVVVWKKGVIFEIGSIDLKLEFERNKLVISVRHGMESMRDIVRAGDIYENLTHTIQAIVSNYFPTVTFSMQVLCMLCDKHSLSVDEVQDKITLGQLDYYEKDHEYNFLLTSMDLYMKTLGNESKERLWGRK
ncbi:leucine-rich repeat-containing protein, putative [Entamoeba invadens IP1]|uniref:Leucine-rich repeat-containing protein, putative n=1 Tax=Entamoeba invadens IP1 TaxID=370355 RepID=A0A0A1U4T1_ENTIV|nr:leucine-rich repeat-containing protein, putative [Entamoeba invadens IP1]ELP89204.1 leucine-rich repeat-containing protein, putative [Entamoeba invadens IP1]|eukprot:XP_004255975.1 leucine-rich repeat-containing protein, putative [Entamoeba invadens IP1]